MWCEELYESARGAVRYRRMNTYGGDTEDGYRDYSDAIPVLAITLEHLRRHGPYEAL